MSLATHVGPLAAEAVPPKHFLRLGFTPRLSRAAPLPERRSALGTRPGPYGQSCVSPEVSVTKPSLLCKPATKMHLQGVYEGICEA